MASPMATTAAHVIRTKIRRATEADIVPLSVMGTRFVRYASYGRHMLTPKEEIAIGLRQLFAAGAVAWVAEREEVIIGVLIGMLAPVWFSPSSKVATELAWWVEEGHRNGPAGVRLLRMFEGWAQANDARFIAMSDLVVEGETPAGHLLERLGYGLVERTHLRRI